MRRPLAGEAPNSFEIWLTTDDSAAWRSTGPDGDEVRAHHRGLGRRVASDSGRVVPILDASGAEVDRCLPHEQAPSDQRSAPLERG